MRTSLQPLKREVADSIQILKHIRSSLRMLLYIRE
jgi:hypothetical protein